ncbi:MAG: hypothetical protein R3A47_06150 [Polyangiales bacterium]
MKRISQAISVVVGLAAILVGTDDARANRFAIRIVSDDITNTVPFDMGIDWNPRDPDANGAGSGDEGDGLNNGGDSGSDNGSGTDDGSGTDSGTGTGTDSGTGTGTDSGTGTGTDSGTGTGTDSGTGTKSNNGHGNNADGVDSSNPGQGGGGPNGGIDASGTVDDELGTGSKKK